MDTSSTADGSSPTVALPDGEVIVVVAIQSGAPTVHYYAPLTGEHTAQIAAELVRGYMDSVPAEMMPGAAVEFQRELMTALASVPPSEVVESEASEEPLPEGSSNEGLSNDN